MNSNILALKGFCVIVPAALMAAAHWFPYRKVLGRHLYELEAYTIGTAIIVGTATVAISLAKSDSKDHVFMLGLATASGGIATVIAHMIDEHTSLRATNKGLAAQMEALKRHGENI